MLYRRLKTIQEPTFPQGYINATYQRLVELFGEPSRPELLIPEEDRDGTLQVEWLLSLVDGTLVRINDWKKSKKYLGETLGQDPIDITEWQIQSTDRTSRSAHNMIQSLING